jgi:ferredoxin-NADP reductase
MAFHFAKPAGFTHRAGQSMLVRLVSPPETDAEGDSRTFTIASAPHEPDLMIATRIRDTAFKRILKSMPFGTRVTIDGPDGQMVLHDDASRPAVLLAGGIGITPFRAMAVHAAREKLPHRFYLFYSNRRPEDAAFLAELQQLEEVNPNYRLIATMTGSQKSSRPWAGERISSGAPCWSATCRTSRARSIISPGRRR